MPWEDPSRGLIGRFFGTVADAFRPSRSAPTFMRSRWRAGLGFFALSFVPAALLSGIIPYTHTLAFGASQVRLIGSPGSNEIALDIARAAAIGLAVALAKILCLAIPYHSLSRAYASGDAPSAALSAMLYRGWLIPLGEVVLSLVMWTLPIEPSEAMIVLTYAASIVPLLVLISSMLATARMASGVGPVAALVVVLVPFVLMMVITPMGMQALSPLLPSSVPVEAVLRGS